MTSLALEEFARYARTIRDDSFPRLPIPGGPEPPRTLKRTYLDTLQLMALRLDRRERARGQVLLGALDLLMGPGDELRGAFASWRSIPGIEALDDGQIESVVRLINDTFLDDVGIRWTAHGLKRTFSFWSPDEKVGYLRFCNEVLALLQRRFGRACLAYGAVLGLVREDGHLNPIDDDVDMLVALPARTCPNFETGLQIVAVALAEAGYRTDRGEGMLTHHWVFGPEGSYADVFVGIIEGETVASFPGPRRGLRVADMFPPLMADIEGVTCPVPRDPETYVERVYGPSWRVPQIVYSHRGARWSEFADLGGPPVPPPGP